MKLVILCGGSGTRLWPVSRTKSPKQFAKLFNNKSLFELTIERNKDQVDGMIIVVNEKQLPLCQNQIPKELLAVTKFIIEPVGRNTAPAITLAALIADSDDLLIVPSDHLIKDQEIYNNCIQKAQSLSKENKLVTFGLKPLYPETGFGYIEAQDYQVLSFKEKPDQATAQSYIEAGNFFWNSGMFFFNSEFFLKELKQHQSEIHQLSSTAIKNAQIEDSNIYKVQQEDMIKIPSDSIDYAVMEKSTNVNVVPSNFYWTDLGSFDSLYNILEKDDLGNTKDKNYIGLNSKNNLVISSKRIITTFDVEDLIIVDTEDALLIGKKGDSQKVKELLSLVKEDHQDLLD